MFRRFSTFSFKLFSPLQLAFAMTLTAVTAFGQAGPSKPAQTKAQARPGVKRSNITRPSVILITIDTLRADHVGCYGAQTVKTPTLDALAHQGVVFERAISQVPLTWPSHAVILTGTYPFQNGVQDFTGQPLAQQFRSVAQAFRQAGYATGAVVSAFVLDRSWGLARGFDFYDDAFSAETFEKKDIGLVDRRAGESVAHAIAWLKKTPRRPFFFWLHLYDPHSPYDPPEPYRTEYHSHLYDGEIAYADHELSNLMAWLKQNHLYDSSLIVALSDHGESLGEHGEDEHGLFVYNATVHVPLIVKPPAGSGIDAGRRREPVETTAVAPTLLQLAGVKDSSDSIHSLCWARVRRRVKLQKIRPTARLFIPSVLSVGVRCTRSRVSVSTLSRRPCQSCTILKPTPEKPGTLPPRNQPPLPCFRKRCRHSWPTIPSPVKIQLLGT